jgi:hypothetical protein
MELIFWKGARKMSRRAVGVAFIGFSVLLYSTCFLSAALWGQGFSSWNAKNFQALLSYVDQGLSSASIISLVLGSGYLLWGEIDEIRSS